MDTNNEQIAESCAIAIKDFVSAVRPSRYSTEDLQPLDLLDAESKLNQAWVDFQNLTTRGWEVVHSEMARFDELYLWYYSLRMAEMAVRRSDESFVGYGLIALVVCERYTDRRDLFTALALLLDAGKRIDADVWSIFGRVAELGSSEKKETIMNYLNARGNEKSMDQVLEGVGYAASGSKENFKYSSTPL